MAVCFATVLNVCNKNIVNWQYHGYFLSTMDTAINKSLKKSPMHPSLPYIEFSTFGTERVHWNLDILGEMQQ